ncbi:MAG: SMI1/KNR4 family protein [Bacillota bacterium]
MFFSKKKKDYFYLLEKHLESGDYNICACGENAPSEKDIKEFEKIIGYRLPEEFRQFTMSSLGGLYVEVKEEIWPRAKQYDVGPFWSFLYGLIVYGISHDAPDWIDIRKKYNDFKVETETDYCPFMNVVCDADTYCFGKDGRIYIWNHETYEFEHVEKNFIELLDYELCELKQRKVRKQEQLKSK